ncbi:NAD(P)/FAD-dependent oxidoreductase [Halomonas sp. 3H]|uniref:flavin-containing monooxygenase n=1 Tax=Halomonas sp. 3H TaxID=2952527 RepID=UPI0020B7D6DA|nr:NAD(P)/FAD-dependent oxidoreductase [Halomonas sp. 3H]
MTTETHNNKAELGEALRAANIPSLLMTLFQLTGDDKWLRAPYKPTKNRGLGDHRTGGLPEQRQEEIRAAAGTAIAECLNGARARVPSPDTTLLHRMMEVCMGEEVPPDYIPMVASQMGFGADGTEAGPGSPDSVADAGLTVIIGAGVSGLLAALRLKQLGLPFVILERQSDVGGNWLGNRYPGCGVDTPSYLYSYSFFQRDWSTHFAKRDEVMTYLRDMANEHGLLQYIRFGVDVAAARYNETARRWQLELQPRDGDAYTLEACFVISAVGLFHTPKVPAFPGLEQFQGAIFHSATWPDDLDISKKRVAIVGTGASAMQIVPAIANKVAELHVYQRSPQWIAPSDEYFQPLESGHHWLVNNVPYYYNWYRFRLAWTWTDKIYPALQKDPDWPHPERSMNAINDGHREFFTKYMMDMLDGRDDLLRKALPDYPPFGKRILLDNGWFTTLRKPHVSLHAEAVSGFTKTGITSASGEHVEVDVIVLCTGFEAQNFAQTVDFRGRGNVALRDAWDGDNARAYLGIATPGFPNLFFMYGPNTNPIGGSYISIAECQVNYIGNLLDRVREQGADAVEIRKDVHDAYNRDVDSIHEGMVWAHRGMQTYYRNSRGRVVTNIPWRFVEYWNMTRTADLSEYVVEPADSNRAALAPQRHHG